MKFLHVEKVLKSIARFSSFSEGGGWYFFRKENVENNNNDWFFSIVKIRSKFWRNEIDYTKFLLGRRCRGSIEKYWKIFILLWRRRMKLIKRNSCMEEDVEEVLKSIARFSFFSEGERWYFFRKENVEKRDNNWLLILFDS